MDIRMYHNLETELEERISAEPLNEQILDLEGTGIGLCMLSLIF